LSIKDVCTQSGGMFVQCGRTRGRGLLLQMRTSILFGAKIFEIYSVSARTRGRMELSQCGHFQTRRRVNFSPFYADVFYGQPLTPVDQLTTPPHTAVTKIIPQYILRMTFFRSKFTSFRSSVELNFIVCFVSFLSSWDEKATAATVFWMNFHLYLRRFSCFAVDYMTSQLICCLFEATKIIVKCLYPRIQQRDEDESSTKITRSWSWPP